MRKGSTKLCLVRDKLLYTAVHGPKARFSDRIVLSGTVTDDGLLEGANLVFAWTLESGLDCVDLRNPSGSTTAARFSAIGT